MQTIKNEIRRTLLSPWMLISLVLGLFLVFWHQVTYVWNVNHEILNDRCVESVFYNWIGGNCANFQTFLFFFIIPIISVLPSGYMYFDDVVSGYEAQFRIRGEVEKYLRGRVVATFLSGFLVIVIPLMISITVTALKFPFAYPEPVMGLGPNIICFDSDLYYDHPMLHTLIYIIIDGLYGGGIALFAMTGVSLWEHRFSVIITPFAIHYFLFSLDRLLSDKDLAPNYFLIPGFYSHYLWELIVMIAIIIANVVFIVVYGRRKGVS